VSVLWEERLKVARFYESVAGATSQVRRPLRHSLAHLNDPAQPFQQVLCLMRSQPVLVQ